MSKADTATITPAKTERIKQVAPSASTGRLPVVPASLEARFVRPAQPIAVTFAKPVEQGRPELLTGNLMGTMHARGAIHHHRVQADGVLWLVPPVWLTPASTAAVTKAMEPPPVDDFAMDMAAAFGRLTAQWAALTDEEVVAAVRRSKREYGV